MAPVSYNILKFCLFFIAPFKLRKSKNYKGYWSYTSNYFHGATVSFPKYFDAVDSCRKEMLGKVLSRRVEKLNKKYAEEIEDWED